MCIRWWINSVYLLVSLNKDDGLVEGRSETSPAEFVTLPQTARWCVRDKGGRGDHAAGEMRRGKESDCRVQRANNWRRCTGERGARERREHEARVSLRRMKHGDPETRLGSFHLSATERLATMWTVIVITPVEGVAWCHCSPSGFLKWSLLPTVSRRSSKTVGISTRSISFCGWLMWTDCC